MKEKMYSAQANRMLHDHILDGFASSHKGIQNLKNEGIIKEEEYTVLLEKNIERLIDRVKEFRLMERMLCIFFAILFGYLQVAGDDLEMRRGRRARSGRRRNESEMPVYL
jgi:hypothetical protein